MTATGVVPRRRPAAPVTDGSGTRCHAATASRELGVPCIVGTRQATTVVHEGDFVSADTGAGASVPRLRSTTARGASGPAT